MCRELPFRVETFKKVFDNENGKLVLDYLKEIYIAPANFDNNNMTYYGMGKRDAVKEMISLTEYVPKKK